MILTEQDQRWLVKLAEQSEYDGLSDEEVTRLLLLGDFSQRVIDAFILWRNDPDALAAGQYASGDEAQAEDPGDDPEA